MKFIPTQLNDAYIIELDLKKDDRGFFTRTFCTEIFKQQGLETFYPQNNHSRTTKKHTLRGMHFQKEPAQEVKVVRCTRGKILDVIIDIRKESSTFGQHIKVELSEENNNMLYVPKGFAHGFLTLEDICDVLYMVSSPYTPEKEAGIRWNDPAFNIQWPVENPFLSEKDAAHPNFKL